MQKNVMAMLMCFFIGVIFCLIYLAVTCDKLINAQKAMKKQIAKLMKETKEDNDDEKGQI